MAVCEYSAHDVTVSRREARRDRTSVLAAPGEVGAEPGAQQHMDGAGLGDQHVHLTCTFVARSV